MKQWLEREEYVGRLPSAIYRIGREQGLWLADIRQEALLPDLDRIHRAHVPKSAWRAFASKWFAPKAEKGLYIYGNVGVGKTFLMDLLHASVPANRSNRQHFHHFMAWVHVQLKQNLQIENPLRKIAAGLAEKPLLCLDEFMVHDIGDAMILSGLLEGFFDSGGTLVTTSNSPPDELYKDGLQRAKFLPAIRLIQRFCDIRELTGAMDYRTRVLKRAEIYHQPNTVKNTEKMVSIFNQLASGDIKQESAITVHDRQIRTKKLAKKLIWFEFSDICEGPRAVADYMYIAEHYPTVFLSHVPIMTRYAEDAAKRFIHLIDAFYDRKVKLIVMADALPQALYQGEKHHAEFRRTASRLIEMQSQNYITSG